MAQVIALAREIGNRSSYVGAAAFLVFALMRKMRVCLWIGGERKDLIAEHAPWAASVCTAGALADAILVKTTTAEDTWGF